MIRLGVCLAPHPRPPLSSLLTLHWLAGWLACLFLRLISSVLLLLDLEPFHGVRAELVVQRVRLQEWLAVQVVRLDDVHRLLHLLLLLQVQRVHTVPDGDGHRVVLQYLLAVVVLVVVRVLDG